MNYVRMPIEIESPEQMGYDKIKYNLTESSYTDAFFKNLNLDLSDLLVCYADHIGHVGLRELIAQESKTLTKEDVLITVGASGALFIIATTLLKQGDEVVVVRPNYATNIETPKAIGATIKYIDLTFENGFKIDIAALQNAVTANTKYISVTHPHNPTGVCLADVELKELAAIAEKNNCYLLVDETYRDMAFENKLAPACDYSPNIISVSSLSKTYGLPGIRVGWITCRNNELMHTFLAAKEQIHICGSVLDEEVAYRYLQHKNTHLQPIQKDIEEKFNITKNWIENQNDFEWVQPSGGVVCFPRIKDSASVDIDLFYKLLNQEHGTYVGPGHWFEMPRQYMRVGFGWPTQTELKEGLLCLNKAVQGARK